MLLRLIIIGFGLLLIYQLAKKLLGGSWTSESVMMGFLFTLVLLMVETRVSLVRVESDLKHLRNQFNALARDFKQFLSQEE